MVEILAQTTIPIELTKGHVEAGLVLLGVWVGLGVLQKVGSLPFVKSRFNGKAINAVPNVVELKAILPCQESIHRIGKIEDGLRTAEQHIVSIQTSDLEVSRRLSVIEDKIDNMPSRILETMTANRRPPRV